MAHENSLQQFIVISKHRLMSHYLPKFDACLEKINEDGLWHKETGRSNSIGGIILHIVEHIKRNTERLRNRNIRFENGIEHYFPDAGMSCGQLRQEMKTVFEKFAKVLEQSPPETVDMYNVYHLVEHTGYHLGQVVDRVQMHTRQAFEFVQNGINERILREKVELDDKWYF
jgi:hypothetical protein